MKLMPLVKTKDQGKTSACVPVAGSMWLEYLLMRLGYYVDLAWQEAAQALTGAGGSDQIKFLDYLKSTGLPDSSGRHYRLKSWELLGTDDKRKGILDSGRPLLCVTKIPVYDQFPPPYPVERAPMPPRYGNHHAGVIIGYDAYGWIVQQPLLWWGIDGIITLPWDYEMLMTATGVLEDLPPAPERVIRLPVGSNIVTINGKLLTIDAPAESRPGRTLVPLRFIAEAFGAAVEWDELTKVVTITR